MFFHDIPSKISILPKLVKKIDSTTFIRTLDCICCIHHFFTTFCTTFCTLCTFCILYAAGICLHFCY